MKRLIFTAILASCATNSKKVREPSTQLPPAIIESLEEQRQEILDEVDSLKDADGWLGKDCDAMLWHGKLAVAPEITINLRAAETEPGKYYRHPADEPVCSASWSRDMGLGLFVYALARGDRTMLEEHAAYGVDHFWKMGEPLGDGRVLYSPNMISILYQLIYKLGGKDNILRRSNGTYPKGLDDYRAHLQMLSIYLRSEVSDELTKTMRDRIREHADREPNNPFYALMRSRIDGNVLPVAELLLRDDKPVGSYVRCDDSKTCFLAERLFVLALVLRDAE